MAMLLKYGYNVKLVPSAGKTTGFNKAIMLLLEAWSREKATRRDGIFMVIHDEDLLEKKALEAAKLYASLGARFDVGYFGGGRTGEETYLFNRKTKQFEPRAQDEVYRQARVIFMLPSRAVYDYGNELFAFTNPAERPQSGFGKEWLVLLDEAHFLMNMPPFSISASQGELNTEAQERIDKADALAKIMSKRMPRKKWGLFPYYREDENNKTVHP